MKIVVWVVSSLLALALLGIGASKLLISTEDLEAMSQGVPVLALRIAGVTEILGAFGLILPAAARILPILTPIAAAALTVQLLAASVINIVIAEYGSLVTAVVLMLASAFVAWARFGPYAIQPRSAPNVAQA